MSDDGEPHGKAGHPTLNTLLHAGVGEVVAVVTRWFGGVQLGKGGLSRAYAGVVARALETLPTELRGPELKGAGLQGSELRESKLGEAK